VTDATLEDSTGVSAIDDASAQAVRKWTFKPATTDCKAVASAVEYTVPIGEDAHTFADPCNHDTMVAVQAQPEYPDAARNLRLGERAVSVRINVDGAGRVVYAGIIESSENMALDQAALMAARQSTYYPTVHACTPVSGSYTFTVTYDPGS
jgi:TonB family protein